MIDTTEYKLLHEYRKYILSNMSSSLLGLILLITYLSFFSAHAMLDLNTQVDTWTNVIYQWSVTDVFKRVLVTAFLFLLLFLAFLFAFVVTSELFKTKEEEETYQTFFSSENDFFIISFFRKVSDIVEYILMLLASLIVMLVKSPIGQLLLVTPLLLSGVIGLFDFPSYSYHETLSYMVAAFTLLLSPLPFYIIVKLVKFISSIYFDYTLVKFIKNYELNFNTFKNIHHFSLKVLQFLNSDKHLGLVIDNKLNDLSNTNQYSIKYYLKRFELYNVVRIFIYIVIKFVLKSFLILSKPIGKLFKAKYLYFLVLPVIYPLLFLFQLIFLILKSLFTFIISLFTSFLYSYTVIFIFSVMIVFSIAILVFNSIAFESLMSCNGYIGCMIFNIIGYLFINIFLAVATYKILPEFKEYYNLYWIYIQFKHEGSNENIFTKIKIFTLTIVGFISAIYSIIYLVTLVPDMYVYISLESLKIQYDDIASQYVNVLNEIRLFII